MQKFSFVIPCYNSSKTIGGVVNEITEIINDFHNTDYEIILVNDCSPDNTFQVIKELAEQDSHIIAIDLAKNVGQAGATMCGFNHVSGDYIICSDDDGQTPLCELQRLKDELESGNYDVVCAKYVNRDQNSILRNVGTKINDFMSRIILNQSKDLCISVFFIAKKFIIDEITRYKNPYPYITGLLLRTTKNIGNVEMEQRDRETGRSGYTFGKLMSLWINGFTAFSVKPLRLAMFLGFLVSIIGFIFGICIIVNKIIDPSVVLAGYSSMMTVLLFIGGVIMILLGMIGEYIGRIYISINMAPQYTVKEKFHLDDKVQ